MKRTAKYYLTIVLYVVLFLFLGILTAWLTMPAAQYAKASVIVLFILFILSIVVIYALVIRFQFLTRATTWMPTRPSVSCRKSGRSCGN